MSALEAADAANLIKPKVAIPMHFESLEGCDEEVKAFESLCKCKVQTF